MSVCADEPNGDSASNTIRQELREKQLLLLHELDQRILDHSYTLGQTLSHVVDKVRATLNAGSVDILFEHADGLRIEFSSDREQEQRVVPRDQSLSGLALANDEPIVVNDLEDEPELRGKYFPRGDTADTFSIQRSILNAPVYLDSHAVGVVNVESRGHAGFSEAHVDFIEAIAGQVSLALTHAALFDEDVLRSEVDNLLLSDASSDNDLILRQALDSVLGALRSFGFIDAEAAEILFNDPEDPERLVIVYSTNTADIGVRVGVDATICGEAFLSNRSVVLQRAREHEKYQPLQEGMKCQMAIPINLGGSERFSFGVLNIESTRENAFSRVAVALAERFARRVVNLLALTKIRADLDGAIQDQLLVLAADQVLNAVHRINNHVGSARALAKDLIEDLQLGEAEVPDEVLRRLELIVEEATLGLQIPDELRKRIGAPQVSADVNEQVRSGIEALRLPKIVQLDLELSDGLPSIPCTALDLVVENLGLNAIDAMKGAGGDLRVRTFLAHSASQAFVVLQVEDTGVGMSAEQVASLFEPRHSARGRGLGFGLVWVKAWVRRAHGVIEVRSARGVGTTVTIRFQIEPLAGEPV